MTNIIVATSPMMTHNPYAVVERRYFVLRSINIQLIRNI